ncbi:MAG TPA: MotA/TolQ/ExbB proton channel family protein, partial [Planctomycetaceae bacterium]|nr:MotA/TolQ/ExbB proton channel family protein [Planctomycetaceae bacterium]
PAAPGASGPSTPEATGQAEPEAGASPPSIDPVAEAERRLAAPEEDRQEAAGELPAPQEIAEQINLLTLLVRGGWLMVPILAMSLVVVTFGLERFLGLRRRKVLPPKFIRALGRLASEPGGLDPRKAYRLCQQYPSSAARVVRACLLKVGRPHGELERAVSETSQREAAKLYTNVRWLSLAAGVTPLLGLLGTVWGMIQAFFATANLPVGANKAEYLAEGIYVALVTTFAGLAVAIPAAVLAHVFEGRIQTLFRELDETLATMLPQLERFEGRLRGAQPGAGAVPSETAGEQVLPARAANPPK